MVLGLRLPNPVWDIFAYLSLVATYNGHPSLHAEWDMGNQHKLRRWLLSIVGHKKKVLCTSFTMNQRKLCLTKSYFTFTKSAMISWPFGSYAWVYLTFTKSAIISWLFGSYAWVLCDWTLTFELYCLHLNCVSGRRVLVGAIYMLLRQGFLWVARNKLYIGKSYWMLVVGRYLTV